MIVANKVFCIFFFTFRLVYMLDFLKQSHNVFRFSSYIKREVEDRFWALLFGFNLVFNKKGNLVFFVVQTHDLRQMSCGHEKTNILHICENKGADHHQLYSNCEADHGELRLCFRYSDSTILLLPKSKISSL